MPLALAEFIHLYIWNQVGKHSIGKASYYRTQKIYIQTRKWREEDSCPFCLGNPRMFPIISSQVMGHQHKSSYKLLWIHFKLYLSTWSPINSQEGRWVELALGWHPGVRPGDSSLRRLRRMLSKDWNRDGDILREMVAKTSQGLWHHRRKSSQRDANQEERLRALLPPTPHRGTRTTGFFSLPCDSLESGMDQASTH